MVILKNACNLKSMREMTNEFNKEECIENLRKWLGNENLEKLPHYDTINDFLPRVNQAKLERRDVLIPIVSMGNIGVLP
jgi:hypothetical protein